MTVKGKTDTNGYLFKQIVIHSSSIQMPKKIHSKRSTNHSNGLHIHWKYISILSKYRNIHSNGSDIHLNSLCICSPTRGVRLENCSILLVNQSYNQLYGLIIVFIRSYSLPFSSTLSILLIHSNG